MRNSHSGAALGLALVLTLGLTGAAVADEAAGGEYAAALAKAEAAGQVMVVDFYADW